MGVIVRGSSASSAGPTVLMCESNESKMCTMSRVQQRLSGLQKAGYVDPDDERIQKAVFNAAASELASSFRRGSGSSLKSLQNGRGPRASGSPALALPSPESQERTRSQGTPTRAADT